MSESHEADIERVKTPLEKAVERNRRWYYVQAALFIIGGLIAVVLPTLTVLGVELLLAGLLIASGVFQLYHGIDERSGWMIGSGVLSLLVGIALLAMPMTGAVALATTIAVFLLLEGIVEIVLSMRMRFNARWGWLMASGVLSLLLGALLLLGWPSQTVVLAGILLGVNFLFYGISMLALALSVKRD